MIVNYAQRPRLDGDQLLERLFSRSQEMWSPPVDIKDTETEVVFSMDIPGMKQEDIHIEITGDTLSVKAHRETEAQSNANGYVQVERTWGTFQRQFSINVPIKTEQVSASYKDGVLWVRLPKADEATPKRVNISID
jgi:HSP20 family protein